MKKLLFTINSFQHGGPSRVVYNIIKSLDKNEYKIVLLTLFNVNDPDYINELKQLGVEVIELNYKKSLKELLKNRKNIISTYETINADIIHAHGLVTSIFLTNNKIKSKKIVTIHNNMYEDYVSTYGHLKGWIYIFLHQNCLRKIDKIICCSKAVYDSLSKKYNNITYIRNGIDPSPKNSTKKIRKDLNIPSDAMVYIYCGVLIERKKILELTKMFSNCLDNNEYFLIVGDGPLFEQIKNLENEHIKVLGFKKNIIDYYSASDVYVSNSSSEGFSISIIEALNSGLYLLLSSIPSHEECFHIDDNYYIGECFDKNTFIQKKNKLKQKILKNGHQNYKLKEFQTKYLSSESMAKMYDYNYKN